MSFLGVLARKGAPVIFTDSGTPVYDPITDTTSGGTSQPITGQAMQVAGDPDRFAALNLVLVNPVTLLVAASGLVVPGTSTPGAVLFADTFTRANSATTLGAPWVVAAAPVEMWGIDSNRAYSVSDDGSNPRVATVPTGASDVRIEATVSNVSTGIALIARFADITTYWQLVVNGGLALQAIVDQAPVQHATAAYVALDGDTAFLQCVGGTFTAGVLRAGEVVASLSVTGMTDVPTGGSHGIGANSGVPRFDNVAITGPTIITTAAAPFVPEPGKPFMWAGVGYTIRDVESCAMDGTATCYRITGST